jgi:hypothetical protein
MEIKIMKNLTTYALAAALVMASAVPSLAGFDSYNATLNSPESKQAFLARTCSAQDASSVLLCESMKVNGVPDSDSRVAAIALGVVVGGALGMVAAGVPVAALGGKTLIGQWGITSILGAAPTVAVVGATGAVIGGALGTAVAVGN